MKDIIIIGGGLAGLISAIRLSGLGYSVLVIEKKIYPFHRVCGEYISNEVVPFFKTIGIHPADLGASNINKFQLSSPSGKLLQLPLQLGGFGISRYHLDNHLYELAIKNGSSFVVGKSAESVDFKNDNFKVTLSDGSEYQSKIAIGAFGKSSKIDKYLNRSFLEKRSPYVGVKYHIKTDFVHDCVALHNFKDGYCGIVKIEADKFNLCYLTTRENLRREGSIPEMEKNILQKNPFLKSIFQHSEFLSDKPEVINEFSFERKKNVENHVLMAGDAAGLITPLCGNGMAMAIHSGKLVSELVEKYFNKEFDRKKLEEIYEVEWNNLFCRRLWVGRKVQSLFGSKFLSEAAVQTFKMLPLVSKFIVKETHGKPF